MNSKSIEDVNINEQRRCLNELDEEIERAIQGNFYDSQISFTNYYLL